MCIRDRCGVRRSRDATDDAARQPYLPNKRRRVEAQGGRSHRTQPVGARVEHLQPAQVAERVRQPPQPLATQHERREPA
eukprot:2923239-Prymnesium_polylepis.1